MGRIFVAQNSFARCTEGPFPISSDRRGRTILSGIEVALLAQCGCTPSRMSTKQCISVVCVGPVAQVVVVQAVETPHSSVRRFVHERDHLRDVVFSAFVVRVEDGVKSRRNICRFSSSNERESFENRELIDSLPISRAPTVHSN